MPNEARFWLDPKTWAFVSDIGLSPRQVLGRAGLPGDLLSRGPVAVDDDAYYRLWQAIDCELKAPSTAVAVVEALSSEVLVAPIFAALCAADLTGAALRMAQFKPLICGSRLHIASTGADLTISQDWSECGKPPPELVWTELLLFVQLARVATRSAVKPTGLIGPALDPASAAEVARYAGVEPRELPDFANSGGSRPADPTITFDNEEATRRFFTLDDTMWSYFEPGLLVRLDELNRDTNTTTRVRSLLVELVPGGRGTMTTVANKLTMSPRTLQRRLKDESTTFQEVLAVTRAELAEQFLQDEDLPLAQIALLLGYEDPTSFHRSYRQWTGHTPAKRRATLSRAPATAGV